MTGYTRQCCSICFLRVKWLHGVCFALELWITLVSCVPQDEVCQQWFLGIFKHCSAYFKRLKYMEAHAYSFLSISSVHVYPCVVCESLLLLCFSNCFASLLSSQDAADMFQTNVMAVIALTKTFSQGMLARNRGHIVNMSSIAGHVAYPGGIVQQQSLLMKEACCIFIAQLALYLTKT